jgi:hypothetical protein
MSKKVKEIVADNIGAKWDVKKGTLLLTKRGRQPAVSMTFNLRETETLVSLLIKVLPFVDNRIELAWNVRHKPRLRLLSTWTGYVEDGQPTIRADTWTVEIVLMERIIHQCSMFKDREHAISYARYYLEDSLLEPYEEEEDDISRFLAEREAIKLYVQHLQASTGMSLNEIQSQLLLETEDINNV